MILRRIHIELCGIDCWITGLCREIVHKERRVVLLALITWRGKQGEVSLIEICGQARIKEFLREASLRWIEGCSFLLLELLIEVLALYVSRFAETTL